jgi:hypothetical protein
MAAPRQRRALCACGVAPRSPGFRPSRLLVKREFAPSYSVARRERQDGFLLMSNPPLLAATSCLFFSLHLPDWYYHRYEFRGGIMPSDIRGDIESKVALRFFISYAREEYNIAFAVNNAIQIAVGPAAEVWMDIALPFGTDFSEEITTRLDETNILVVINSEILKSEFAYPGLELGYFIRVMKESGAKADFPRRIVPIYLGKPPAAIAEHEGINIGISRATLNMTLEEYKATLQNIDFDDGGVRLLRQFQQLVNDVREQHGKPRLYHDESQRDLPGIVAKMQLAIFSHLKTTLDPEGTLKPQYQITLKTSDSALSSIPEGQLQLPGDTRLVPVGTGTPLSSIFGLRPTPEITWDDFRQQSRQHKFCDSWSDAITQVVSTSLKSQLAKDNSQVIVSYDETKAYRVILTTGLRYFNGEREFNIYFVEYLKPKWGDPETTRLFEGLELSCRFRSLFLERKSEFSSTVCKVKPLDGLKAFASRIERELNLLRRDALEAGLDNPAVWAGLVNPDLLIGMSQAWQPLDLRAREVLTQTRRSEVGNLEGCRESLTAVLQEMEKTMRPLNAQLIAEMAEKLKTDAL